MSFLERALLGLVATLSDQLEPSSAGTCFSIALVISTVPNMRDAATKGQVLPQAKPLCEIQVPPTFPKPKRLVAIDDKSLTFEESQR